MSAELHEITVYTDGGISHISPELIMSREETHSTSLASPSGFLLSWLATIGDDEDIYTLEDGEPI